MIYPKKAPLSSFCRRSHRVRPFVSGNPATGRKLRPVALRRCLSTALPFSESSAIARCDSAHYIHYRIKHRSDQQTIVSTKVCDRLHVQGTGAAESPIPVAKCDVVCRAQQGESGSSLSGGKNQHVLPGQGPVASGEDFDEIDVGSPCRIAAVSPNAVPGDLLA